MAFELNASVEVSRDEDDQVVELRHVHEPYTAEAAGVTSSDPADVAEQYVRDVADLYAYGVEDTATLRESTTGEAADEAIRLREAKQRTVLDTTVMSYQQTVGGLPVWNSTLSVTLAGDPPAVVSSTSNLHRDLEVDPGFALERVSGLGPSAPSSLYEAIGVADPAASNFRFNGERLLVYRYEPDERIDPEARTVAGGTGGGAAGEPGAGVGGFTGDDASAGPGAETVASGDDPGDAGHDPDNDPPLPAGGATAGAGGGDAGHDPGAPSTAGATNLTPLASGPPTLDLPPVPAAIVPGRHYVVREVLFSLTVDGDDLNWRAFVEPDTGAVLYLRALTSAATCAIFQTDPVTSTGNPLSGSSPAAQLDAARTTGVPLQNLDGPNGGLQALAGTWARLQDTDAPPIAAPTESAPFAFEYSAVTDNFSAANAYYHTDWMYRLVEGMGFDLNSYFDGTTFPVPVDHRGENGDVNAHAHGNVTGTGMGRFRYGLVGTGQPVGIATTVRVCLHEFGHTLLWDNVGSPNFGWAHSAGDTMAAILNDPGSRAPDRFETFPFVTASTPGVDRRHDRDVAAGWAFGGTRDNRGYGTEQILSTLMFRIYRVTGGDDSNVATQRFAARYLTYLIVRAIGTLTATTTDPRVFVTALRNADELTTDFEGHPGGAWHKVVRWSFEQQGLFQPPGAPTPVTGPGAPPDVDVFIDDGRNGGYGTYLTDIGNSPGVWNRLASDGGSANQEPVAGSVNHLYARVQNRGTQTATSVRVACHQANPGSAKVWPTDWAPLSTASLAAPDLAPGASTVVGPFAWTPAQSGPISVLASVSATGDESNADTVNGAIPNTRLVPNDNNLAQRDLTATGPAGPACLKICAGSTAPGSTDWKQYPGGRGVYVDVDTSGCNFTTTPQYITSIGGRSSHWATTGATSVYRSSTTGFRIYLRWADGNPLTPVQANNFEWHINWYGVTEG